MASHDDMVGLIDYLKSTPEGALRKMLVSGKLTDAHFRLLMKLAKNSSEADFINAFEKEEIPKMKLSLTEHQIRETFWGPCKAAFMATGLLGQNPEKQAA